MLYRNLKLVFVFVFFSAGCTLPTFKSQPAIPTLEQIQKNSVFQDATKHDYATSVVNRLVQQLQVDEEFGKILNELDSIRYIYIRKAESLLAEGKFEEAQKYVTQANLVLRKILLAIRGNHAAKEQKESPETGFQDPKSFL